MALEAIEGGSEGSELYGSGSGTASRCEELSECAKGLLPVIKGAVGQV